MRVLILKVGFFLFLFSSLAFSGEGRRILAEQELHSGAGAKEGTEELSLFSHRGEAGAGYSFYGGNQDFSLFHYSARYRGLKPESFEIEAAFQGLFGYEKGIRNKNRHSGVFTLDYLTLQGRLSFFYFGNALTDEAQNIGFRTTQGLGVKYKPVKNEYADLSFSGAPVLDYEESDHGKTSHWQLRWSFRPRAVFYFDEQKTNELRATLFYIPLWNDFKNYRLDLTVVLKLKISGFLFFEQRFRYDYNSHPMGGQIKKSNTLLTGGLGLQF